MRYKKKEDKIKAIYETASMGLVEFFGIFNNNPDEYVEPAWFHYEISRILLEEKRNFCIEAFRESGKSSLVMTAFPLYAIMYPRQDLRYIVLIKQNQTLAENKVKEIANYIKEHPLMNIVIENVNKESGSIFDVDVNGINGVRTTIRIEGYGKTSSIRGLTYRDRRPDICIIDDPQDLEDMNSESALRRDWEWFLSEVMFLGKKCRVFIIGNNLGEKCLIERIFENSDNYGFSTLKVPILNEEGNSNWGAKYSKEYILKEKEAYKREGRLDIWYRERMCLAMSEEDSSFKRSDFRYYDEDDENIANLIKSSNIYVLWDAAIAKNDNSCYSAFVTCAGSVDGNIYVLDVIYGKYDFDEAIDICFSLAARYKNYCKGIFKVYIEREKLSNIFIKLITQRQKKENFYFSINEVAPDKAKEARILGLQPRIKSGRILFKKDAQWLDELETELLTFPRGKRNDVIDALAYIEYVIEPYYEINDIATLYGRNNLGAYKRAVAPL